MQSKIYLAKQCRSCGTDPLGSLWSQEFITMLVTPIVRMPHKKRRNHAQFLNLIKLIISNSLSMDNSYPRLGAWIYQLGLLDSLEGDIDGCISVAMRQDINLPLQSLQDNLVYLILSKNRRASE